MQLLEECNLEDLAKEVVKHFSEKQALSVCSLQQAQVTKGHAFTAHVSHLDTVRDCVQKVIHLIQEFPDKAEVSLHYVHTFNSPKKVYDTGFKICKN